MWVPPVDLGVEVVPTGLLGDSVALEGCLGSF